MRAKLPLFARYFNKHFEHAADQAATSGYGAVNDPTRVATDLIAWPHPARPHDAGATLASALR